MISNKLLVSILIVGTIVLGSMLTPVILHDFSESASSSVQFRGEAEPDVEIDSDTNPDQSSLLTPPRKPDASQPNGELSYSLTRTYADGRSEEVQPGMSQSTEGSTRSDVGSHPLSMQITEIVDLEEIAIGNFRKTDVGTIWVFDDTHQNTKKMFTGEFEANALGGSDMGAGDFDGDGLEELVISSQIKETEGEDPKTKTLVSFFDDDTTNFELLGTSAYWMTSASLTVGDLDGDGLDEVAMIGSHQDNVSMGGVVLDDLLAPEPIIHRWDPIDHGWEVDPTPTAHHDITSGDFDGDGRDDLATVGYYNDTLISWVWTLNDQPDEQFPLYDGFTLVTTLPEMTDTKGQPSLSTGELDGDGRDELIMTTHNANWNLHYRIYDDQLTNFEILREAWGNYTIRSTDSTTGDVDGDGLDEIFLVGHQVAHLIGRVLDDADHDFTELKVLDRLFEDSWFYWFNVRVETGDVDGDGYDEYAILGQSYIFLYGELHDDLGPGKGELLETWELGDNKLPTLAIGDFDGDGLVLEYTGESSSFVTPDIPIVAMAAPPIIDGVNQNADDSFTRFGITPSPGYEGPHQFTTSTELSFSFEGKPITMPEGVRSAFLKEFIATGTPIRITGENISLEGNYPDDHILYQSAQYDQYRYTIVSWPGHDDRVGEDVSINVPVSISIDHTSRTEFNADADSEQRIGSETFNHQPGDISTYPTREESTEILSTYPHSWRTTAIAVETGTGMTSTKIDLAPAPINEEYLRYGTHWSHLDGTMAGFGSTMGLTSERIFEVTIGENTQFEGSVGELPAGTSEHLEYSYGMFVYTQDPAQDMPVVKVINYWVEGLQAPNQGDDDQFGYWPFDSFIGTNMTEDQSPGQNDAVVNGATISEGVKEKALAFDGVDDTVMIPLDMTTSNITIEFWLKTSTTDTGVLSISSDPADIKVQKFDLTLKDGFPRIMDPTSGEWGADVNLSDGAWHYCVWTLEEGESEKFYSDGDLVGEHSHDESAIGPGDRMIIGHSSTSSHPYFEGSIDEVTIHQKVLNSSDIESNFQAMGYEPPITKNQDSDDDSDSMYVMSVVIMFGILGGVLAIGINKYRREKMT